jgi:hypothetical protein
MSFAVVSSLSPHTRSTAFEERIMTATYTFDVFSTLDGYGSYGPDGDWGGYWGKQGPEFLDRRLALYSEEQRMVFGPAPIGNSCSCWARAPRIPGRATHRSIRTYG